jgi:transketolase
MGDQVGAALSGPLVYVPVEECARVRELQGAPEAVSSLFATCCRINALYMIARAGSGHIGSSFSCMDILSCLHLIEMQEEDLFFSSKGHDAPAFYSILIGLGRLDAEMLHRLRRLGGLPGHPDVGTPGIVTNTGSLGMGVSKAKGMIKADRLLGRKRRVFVLTGDGELQEGQFWESLASAVRDDMSELTVIVDHNKVQSDTLVNKVSDLGDLEGKLRAFGWHVDRCDGHDTSAIARFLSERRAVHSKPAILIADTVKGRGVAFMEHTAVDLETTNYPFHSGAPSAEHYSRGLDELLARARQQLSQLGGGELAIVESERSESHRAAVSSTPGPAREPERLVAAYTEALLLQAERHPNLVALDADLILDTGLIPFRERYPERFIECGIAEQDMVSQAGGMALQGLLPVVHSFACFLSTRPNEQIYNNATEGTKVIYVGTLAGLVPGGPGHSHQSVRDISALAAVPGLTMMEPCCAAEVAPLLDWAVNETRGSSYLRLVSVPWMVPFRLPAGYHPVVGRGIVLEPVYSQPAGPFAAKATTGLPRVTAIGYGPVLLSQAILAAEELRRDGVADLRVVNLPWLNIVDENWLSELVAHSDLIVTLDNHYRIGGQGDRIAKTLACTSFSDIPFLSFGLETLPSCGENTEVLGEHRLDHRSLIFKISSICSKPSRVD